MEYTTRYSGHCAIHLDFRYFSLYIVAIGMYSIGIIVGIQVDIHMHYNKLCFVIHALSHVVGI